ncbi:MAG: hypothetical protein R3175_00250 [Marinobacter sp.]|uniref:hypothetical protein n=1 Tax=Marinobacter sp. TaxID=50741 RepID=UPI00299D871B|nr:hypothetical protein [Marinobacter sp.]MDX1754469.1 hypothetical protein [Marinobacter sp.]
MSSRTELHLYPSLAAGLIVAAPWLLLLLTTLYLAASGPFILFLATPLALAGALVQFRRCGRLQGLDSVVALSVQETGLWAQLRDGRRLPVRASGDSRLGGRLALLRLSCPGKRFWSRTLVLIHYGDRLHNVDPEPFRQLRVWLKLRPSR